MAAGADGAGAGGPGAWLYHQVRPLWLAGGALGGGAGAGERGDRTGLRVQQPGCEGAAAAARGAAGPASGPGGARGAAHSTESRRCEPVLPGGPRRSGTGTADPQFWGGLSAFFSRAWRGLSLLLLGAGWPAVQPPGPSRSCDSRP